ncbi:hypothetical protein LCGC14_1128730 [marine sediment metagenome]|uniref:YspA cpYpsA-related SLOG domain-containing protein n=1 Tax=marine sediment metagenome TaxID=412755 RepID=A0A0F9MPL0_9ZZZZ
MKVLVCGDRNWSDYLTIQKQIVKLGRSTIIQGEARGADRIAKQVAQNLGWP